MGLATVAVALLAACGTGGSSATTTTLPAGQHDLGDHISVAVHEVKDPVTGSDGHVVAVDLEYFNRGDAAVPMGMAFRVELHDSDGRDGEPVGVSELPQPPSVIPSHSSARGWQTFRIGDDAKPATLVLWGDKIGAEAQPITVDL